MKKEVITFKEPKSPISEVFRTLRTNVQFMNTKKELKSILVTSTSPGEGKTWISANLAVTFAQAGKRVVLVDADMRKGRQFSMFGVPPTPGLSNYLSGVDSNGADSDPYIGTYLRETEVENLYILPAGNVPPNPSELLVSQAMMDCINELENMCDLIIFDGTPTDLVTDAIIISRFVDTTLIVTAFKQTKMDSLQKLKKSIQNVGGKIAGVVINKMPINQKDYYSTYYYYGSSTSSKYKNNKKKSKKKNREEIAMEIEQKKAENRERLKKIVDQNIPQKKDVEKNNNTSLNENRYTNTKDHVMDGLFKSQELIEQANEYVKKEKEKLVKE